jgi:hypothetical protein
MKFLKINIKDFSKYTLTALFYEIKPIIIFYYGNILKIICYEDTLNFEHIRFLKDIGTLKGYQILPFEEINKNYYTCLNREVKK